jgi:hypothetical protein
MNRKKYKKKKGPVRAKKVTYNGINFASGLEKYMYIALKKAKIKAEYEGETFILIESFKLLNESYERCANGKGDFINRGNKKYYLLNIHQTLLAKILLLNVKAELMSPFLYAGSYLKGLCHK